MGPARAQHHALMKKRKRRPLSDSAAAIRKRRERRRRDAGVRLANIEVNFERAIEALKRRDGLSEIQAEGITWAQVEREMQLLADDWLRQWVK
jgi:hypothetical protein